MVKPGASKKRTGTGDLQEELTRELKHLRNIVHEIGENFILRREGEVEAVIANLASVPPRTLRTVADGLLHDLHTLKVKPEKGRLKDLKEIDKLIGALTDRVLTAQDVGKHPRKKSVAKTS